MRLTDTQVIEMEMIAAAEADAEAKGGDIDDIRPCDRVVDVTQGDDWDDFERWYDEHVVPEFNAL